MAQTESKTFDPRFGALLQLTGPNGAAAATSWQVDDFGRTVLATYADGGTSVTTYCYLSGAASDLSSNSANCATPGSAEIPSGAAFFVQQEPHDKSGAKSGPFTRVYSDRAGRTLRSVTESFDGGGAARLIAQDTEYNQQGMAVVSTQPYFLDTQGSTVAGTSHGFSVAVYDALGRTVETDVSDGAGLHVNPATGSHGSQASSQTTIAYVGLDTVTTNDKGQTRREEYNVDGQLTRVTDALGAQIGYQYDAFGSLLKTRDALQNTVSITSNILGWKMSLADPDTGLMQYDYNALGELVWQQSPNQRVQGSAIGTSYSYDALGRQVQRSESPYTSPGSVNSSYTSTWSYDKYADGSACAMGIGKLCEARTDNGVSRKVFYDGIGRPVRSQLAITSGPTFTNAVSYDATSGRIADRTYPSGLKISYGYTGLGYLKSIANGSATYWTAQAVNAWGALEQQQAGNGVLTFTAHDQLTGRTADIAAGTGGVVFHHGYQYDSLSNLTYRADANGAGNGRAVTENYSYDGLNRLADYSISGPDLTVPSALNRAVGMTYNAAGMLLYKSDVGSYSYPNGGAAQAHALQSIAGAAASTYAYDANGNVTTASGGKYRSIAYTSFDLPDSSQGVLGADGTRYTWSYDTAHARIKEVRQNAAGTRTTWEVHPDRAGGLSFEQEIGSDGTTTNRNYLSAYGDTVGMVTTSGAITTPANPQPGDASAAVLKVEYWHKDALGSISAITDATGAVEQRLAYDPFGKRRATNGDYDGNGNIIVDDAQGTDRGYTGHEQLDDVGIVHMNGRMYDALAGRFIQSDPLVGQPGNLQNFNRYGYVLNNPLNATDPSGYDEQTIPQVQVPGTPNVAGAGTLDTNVSSGYSYSPSGFNRFPGAPQPKAPPVVSGPRSPQPVQKVAGKAKSSGYGDDQGPCSGIKDCTWVPGQRIQNAVDQFADVVNVWWASGVDGFKSDSLQGAFSRLLDTPNPETFAIGLVGAIANKAAKIESVVVNGSKEAAALRAAEAAAKSSGQIGREGESVIRGAYDLGIKPTRYIFMNGRARLPDGLSKDILSEIKNVSRLSYTQQLRDYADFAQDTGRSFTLYTRTDTYISGPLQNAIDLGLIDIKKVIP